MDDRPTMKEINTELPANTLYGIPTLASPKGEILSKIVVIIEARSKSQVIIEGLQRYTQNKIFANCFPKKIEFFLLINDNPIIDSRFMLRERHHQFVSRYFEVRV